MLSSELYRIICSWLGRSTLLTMKRTSKHLGTIVDSYLMSKIVNKPYFANMDKNDCLRYLEQSRIVSNDGTFISEPEVIPMQIYYIETRNETEHSVSFIDIDYCVYINSTLVPNIKGKALTRSPDLLESGDYIYFIQGLDGLFYMYNENHITGTPLSLRRISEIYALNHQGKVLRFDEVDPKLPLHELYSKVALPSFVDLIAVTFLYNDHFLRFLIYIKDDQGNHWLMLEQESRVWTLIQVAREKKILQIETCNEIHEWKCFFNVLFDDGSVEPMMVVIGEDDSIKMFYRDIDHHGIIFCELRGEFLYDKQGKEYCVNNDEVEATGYTKWHSRCESCMIAY